MKVIIYKGYLIAWFHGCYHVTGYGQSWTEDTVQDAKAIIDEMEREENNG